MIITSIQAFQTPRIILRNKLTSVTTSLGMSSSDSENSVKHVVIAGGGVIGTCTSYYLAKNHGISSTIIDPSGEIAPAASGKAGGFLALDWNDMTTIRQLTHRSFHLHQTLADALGADKIQYRRLTCASVGVDSQIRRPSGKKFDGVEWAENEDDGKSGVLSFNMMGDEETIAQVHPKMLCQNLWEESSRLVEEKHKTDSNIRSNQLIKGKVVSTIKDEASGKLIGAKLEDGKTVEGDAVLLACGPWTANIMTGIKYHSVIIPTEKVLRQCVFFVGNGDPEVYVRPDSTAYCTGFPDAPIRVTELPGQEEVRPEAVGRIVTAVREASGKNEASGGALAAEPTSTQACYLPSTPDGLPIMGKLPSDVVDGCDNVFVAAGHTCWGILLGPASGETMANQIATGETATDHVSLVPFDPVRFQNILPLS